MRNRLSEQAHEAFGGTAEAIGEHPVSATLVAFGLGLGVGVAIGMALGEPPHRDRGMAEKLGHQLLDAMMQVLPKSVTSRM